jgi:hypothetical protein
MRWNSLFKTRLIVACLVMMVSLSAAAQSDQGQYRIVSARYGTERKNVDVTARLKELARQDFRFRMGNSTFGVDPDRGVVKTLRIYARGPNGGVRMFEYREGSVVDGSMFTDWGRGSWGEGNWNGGWNGGGGGPIGGGPGGGGNRGDDGAYRILNARYGTARNNVDVTARLKELARRDINFRMGNSTFGVDPDPGAIKMLRIFARGPRGETRTFDYREGSIVDGSLFTGWGRGDWGNERWNGGWGEGRRDNDDWRDRDRRGGDDRGRVGSIRVLRATYGSGRGTRDVTSIVQSYVREGRIQLAVNNYTMGGDPAPNTRKSLTVIYSNGNGPQQQASVYEGGSLNIQ